MNNFKNLLRETLITYADKDFNIPFVADGVNLKDSKGRILGKFASVKIAKAFEYELNKQFQMYMYD